MFNGASVAEYYGQCVDVDCPIIQPIPFLLEVNERASGETQYPISSFSSSDFGAEMRRAMGGISYHGSFVVYRKTPDSPGVQ